MKVDRTLSPWLACLTLAGLVGLPLVSMPLTAAQDAAEPPAAAETPEAGEARPQRQTRWDRLREKILVEGAEYAGTETCAQSRCHSATVQTWSGLRHTKHVLQAPDWSEEERSCEGCHGPASAHLIDRQHGRIARLSDHPEYVAALCNSCHHNNVQETHFLAGVHIREKVNCGTCHDVHRDHGSVALLRGPGVRQMWQQYHTKKEKRQPRPTPRPAPEEPEATPAEPATPPPDGAAPVQLTAQAEDTPAGAASPAPDASPAGPAAAPPVRRPAPAAPRQDRGASTGFTTTRFTGEHEKVNALCMDCHQEQRGQFHQNSRHPLFEGRMTCANCHNPHDHGEFGPRGAVRVARDVDNLCNRCHTDKRGPFVFEHDMSLTEDGCLTCHRAHGSPNNKLVKLNGRGLCLQCHSDINLDPAHQRRPGSCWRAGCHSDIHGSQTNRLFLHSGARAQGAARGPGVASRRLSSQETRAHASWVSDYRRSLGALATAAKEEEADPASENETRAAAAKKRKQASAPVGTAKPASGTVRLVALAPAAEPAEGTTATPTPPTEAGEGAASGSRKQVSAEAIGSFEGLNINGNRSKAYQYTVPPSGFFSELLRLTLWDDPGALFGVAQWRGIDEPRQIGALRLENVRPNGAGVRGRYLYDRAAFFVEPGLTARDASDRKNQAFAAAWTPSRRAPELRFFAEGQRVEAPGISRLTTDGSPGGLDYTVERYVPQLRYRLGGGSLHLQYGREEFTDRTLFLPEARTNDWQVQYDRLVGTNTSIFATFARATIDQEGLRDHATNQQARLGVTTRVTPQVTASAQYVSADTRQPNTLNAYMRDRDSFVARLRYRPMGRLSFEGGYERADFRRLNNTQTFVHTPNWDGGWLSMRAVPLDNVTLLARHRIRRLSDAPPAEILGLPSRQPLFFDEDDRTEAQLSVLLPRDALLYVNYGRNRQQNDPREVGFRFSNWNTGVTMPLGARASLNADWSRQSWSGHGDALTNDFLRLNFGRPLNSDGDSINLGLSYLSGQDTLTLNLYRFTASGGESVRAQGILFGYEPRWTRWATPRFQIGWDDYEDRVISGLDYQSAVFRIDLARRF